MTNIFLSEDLIFQILRCLLSKSLVRFRCARKSWYAFISNPDFISKGSYLLTSYKYHTPNLINAADNDLEGYEVFSLVSYDTHEVVMTKKLPFSNLIFGRKEKPSIYVAGSSNGIICLQYNSFPDIDSKNRAILWNPATKETKIIPKSLVPVSPISSYNSYFGLGFDVQTKDFKVVNFAASVIEDRDGNLKSEGFHVQLYSLLDNSWRKIDAELMFPYQMMRLANICMDGIVSLVAQDSGRFDDYEKYENMIVAVDVSKEIVLITHVPEKSSRLLYNTTLTELNGSLAVILYNDNLDKEYICANFMEIWVLGEYGVDDSWTKIFNGGPFPELDL